MNGNGKIQGKLMVILIFFILILIGISGYWLFLEIHTNLIASYPGDIYYPEKTEYCPGDMMGYNYEIQFNRKSGGRVTISDDWCRADPPACSLNNQKSWRVPVLDVNATVTETGSVFLGEREQTKIVLYHAKRLIPDTPMMKPGELWFYVHDIETTSFYTNHVILDRILVPFTIKESCP